MTNLNILANEIHQNNKEKGFWDEKREIGTLLMLVVSELSEALEADRKNKHSDLYAFDYREQDRECTEDVQYDFQELIKDTFEDEIADVFIRMFDLVGHLEIDIERHIELKLAYNKTRQHKHGKLY